MKRKIVLGVGAAAIVLVAAVAVGWLYTRSRLDAGILALKEERYAAAVALLRPIAQLGNAPAQYYLGLMYAHGWGVERDREAAIGWFRRAGWWSEEGMAPEAPAAFYVGRSYDTGTGVERSLSEALEWYRISAEGGYSKAGERLCELEPELRVGQVMAWQWATSQSKRYLLPEDSCYESYQRFLPPDIVQYFSSAQEAERCGFERKAVVLAPLKKYAAVCSDLYEYALASVCEKVFLDDPGRAGFVPIERFTTLANVRVVAIERSRTYLTPCDKDYPCLIDPNEARSSECEQLAKSTGPLRIFSSEREAKEAGYVSEAEAYFSEVTDEPL